MKVALVSQPYDRLFPPSQNSIGLIVYYTALEIARQTDVTVYGKHYRDDVLPARSPVLGREPPGQPGPCAAEIHPQLPRPGPPVRDRRQARRSPTVSPHGRTPDCARPPGHRARDELLALVPRAQGAGLVTSARARNAVRVAVAARPRCGRPPARGGRCRRCGQRSHRQNLPRGISRLSRPGDDRRQRRGRQPLQAGAGPRATHRQAKADPFRRARFAGEGCSHAAGSVRRARGSDRRRRPRHRRSAGPAFPRLPHQPLIRSAGERPAAVL